MRKQATMIAELMTAERQYKRRQMQQPTATTSNKIILKYTFGTSYSLNKSTPSCQYEQIIMFL